MLKPPFSSKYQIVIPRQVRGQFNLKPGEMVMFIPYRNSIRLVIVPPISEARGIFEGITSENIREEMEYE